ncbi:MAG: hypothetical protein IRZ14_21080 [Chloroflexi bacterium]|jgi:hypothetical protein|nr:hypothetical protein [Chloroflexota bacterium]
MKRLLAGLALLGGLFLAAPDASAQYCSLGNASGIMGVRSGVNINPLYSGGFAGYAYYPFYQAWYGGYPSWYASYTNGYPYGQYPVGQGVYGGYPYAGGVAGGGSQPYFGAGYVDPTFYDVATLGNYVNPYYSDLVGNMPFWTGQYGGQYPYYSTFYGGYPAFGGFPYNAYCGYYPYGYGGACSPIRTGSSVYDCR